MPTRRLAVTALSIVAAIVALCAPSAASASVPGTSALRERGARALGAIAPGAMTFTLALAPREPAALRSFVSHRHAALTPAQFDARFAPSQAAVGAVRSWAMAHGLALRSVSSNRLLVQLSGSSTNVAGALGTGFQSFRAASGRRFFPRASSVLGLSNLAKVSLAQLALPSSAGLEKALGAVRGALPSLGLGSGSVSYPADDGPKDFWSMYDAPSAVWV